MQRFKNSIVINDELKINPFQLKNKIVMKKFMSFSFLLAFVVSLSCNVQAASRTLDLDPFSGISLNNSFNVILKQGSKQSVKIEGSQEVINDINTTVKDGNWSIHTKKKNGKWNNNNKSKTTVYITIPKLKKLAVSGSGSIEAGDFNVNDLKLAIGGSGKIKINVSASGDIKSAISGSGNMNLSGKAQSLTASIAGSGSVVGKTLSVKTMKASIAGSGNVYAEVSSSINASIAGSGSVYYTGSASNVSSKTSGSGRVKKRS